MCYIIKITLVCLYLKIQVVFVRQSAFNYEFIYLTEWRVNLKSSTHVIYFVERKVVISAPEFLLCHVHI